MQQEKSVWNRLIVYFLPSMDGIRTARGARSETKEKVQRNNDSTNQAPACVPGEQLLI